MSLRNSVTSARTVLTSSSRKALLPTAAKRAGFASSACARDLEVPPKEAKKAFVKYDAKDALRVEQSLLTEDEIAIKSVDAVLSDFSSVIDARNAEIPQENTVKQANII
jgi:hypothetical protein